MSEQASPTTVAFEVYAGARCTVCAEPFCEGESMSIGVVGERIHYVCPDQEVPDVR